ncbi:MAG TPA: TauD/TfdA family dioxygenase [Herpetosiphonaceae bacterium]
MSNPEHTNSGAKRQPIARRKAVSIAQPDLIATNTLQPDRPLPLLVTPVVDGVRLIEWAAGHREQIESWLLKHGGILLRGFALGSVSDFEQFIGSTADNWAEYREPATPRSQVSANIYTSTDYPPAQRIFLHNENSHTESWPMKIYFFCVTAAQQGGETPIADCRAIFERIDPAVRQRFTEKQIMYVRNFGDGLGYSWEQVFKTTDRREVEAYCRDNQIEAEWKPDNGLRIRYVRPAVAKHPRTDEPVWFNHGTFFHISTQEPAIRESLLAAMPEADLPYNTYYGDGSSIEPEVLNHLRAVYNEATIAFPWQEGDLLMLDNMLVAHGRSSFVGPRKVLVGMAEPCHWSDIQR